MNQYELKQAFTGGRQVYGTLVASPSPKWAAEIRKAGLDFVFIDSEHMPLDPSARAWMCRCYREMNLAPIVRIPRCNAMEAFAAMEAGAAGVIAPYIETAEEVRILAGVLRYRPLKGERLKGVLDGTVTLTEKEREYFRNYNDGCLLLLNIESRHAVDHLDELLTDEVDGVFIGPHDLSINLGIPEEYDHPEFELYVERIIAACRERGIGVGNHNSGSLEKQISWAKKGMNITMWNSDVGRFVQAIGEDFDRVRKALGEESGEARGVVTI
ncbi:MAG: aldolase/citrate lyase family protein [Oscillospiraceae bacterium]|nr:aldolase/citrate lyase family protein [Oscillospiraceae bacterium]